MPVRKNNIFREKIKFDLMLEAYHRAVKGKRENREVVLFEFDLACNLTNILKDIYNDKFHVGDYRCFTIYDPKVREIWALPLRDRIVHQWYVEEFIKPIFLPTFIKDSYACIEGKGLLASLETLQMYMKKKYRVNKEYYILKCDVSKFFYNINKNILYSIIERKVKDKDFLKFTRTIIYEKSSKRDGIPIGNYTSQYFANIYLNEMDHFIKEKLHIKYYVRYMDDFILLLDNKEESIKALKEIRNFLDIKLKLKLNNKTNYFKNKQGVKFCGFHIYNNCIRLGNYNKKSINKRVKYWNKQYKNKTIDFKKTAVSFQSWIGHAMHETGQRCVKSEIQKCNWLYKENN